MKSKKPLSILLSLCMLMTLLPVNALAAESLQEIKTQPGETYTYTEGDKTHSQTVNETFDFVIDDIAYRYLNSVDGDEVAVAEWSWSYSCQNCGKGDQHLTVLHHSFYNGTVSIPSTVQNGDKTYYVTAVDPEAFADFTGTVTLSEGIKTIGREAFYNYRPNPNTTFTVPASVTEIGDRCFERTTATVEFSQDSQLETVGDEAFALLTQESLVLPDGVKILGDQVFNDSNNTAITIPGTVTNLSPSVLSGYTGTLSFTDGPANYEIKDGVLYGWGKLIQVRDKTVTSVAIPEGVTEIGSLAFSNMSSLKTVSLPSTLTTLGYGVFSSSGIESIVIPASVTTVEEVPDSNAYNGLFAFCKSLKTAEIQANWDAIPDYAFNNCTVLESVSFPASVNTIGVQAFEECSALTSVDLSNISVLEESAFYKSGISDVTSLDNLNDIGKSVFRDCKSLKKISLPEGITTLKENTFNNCTGLELLILPSTITSIEKNAIRNLGSSEACSIVMQSETLSTVTTPFGTSSSSTKPSNLTIYYPAEAEAAYKATVLVDESENDGYALDLTDAAMILTTAKAADGSNTLTLKTVTVPEGMTLEATSSNTGVATVRGENGKLVVTGVAEGTATITATLKVGDYVVLEDICTVTVTAEGAVLPSVEEPNVTMDDSIGEDDKEVVKATANSVEADKTISDAAKSEADKLTNDDTKKVELEQKAKAEGLTPDDGEKVTLYTQTFLDIQATNIDKSDSNISKITLNITPKVQVVASTATNSADIDIKTGSDDEDWNAVVVKEAEALTINTQATITVQLPTSFDGQPVYVKHEASNGTYFYKATADAQGEITFTSTHGFSPFTFSLTNEAVAEVDGVGYASFQAAIDAAVNGGTLKVLTDADLNATISGSSKTIYVENATNKDSISVTINGDTFTVAKGHSEEYIYTKPSSGGSSGDDNDPTYSISVPDNVTGGSIKVTPNRASAGTRVTITAKPDSGYELDELIVTDRKGNELKVTDRGDNKYTFQMTNSKVEIEVSFTKIEEKPTGNPFIDVAEGSWYADAVQYVYDKGLMAGTSSTTFGPDATTTRGMIVTILYRLEGAPAISGSSSFTDVVAGQYYAEAVAWAAANNIVGGYGNGLFGPNDTITREQMAAILYRYAQYKGYDVTASADLSGYSDVAQVSSYALAALQWANAEGLVNGTSDTTLTPGGSATRAQVAVILMRFCENIK